MIIADDDRVGSERYSVRIRGPGMDFQLAILDHQDIDIIEQVVAKMLRLITADRVLTQPGMVRSVRNDTDTPVSTEVPTTAPEQSAGPVADPNR